jgi:predicted ATP-dependent endonuclease of OLD family
MLIESITIKGFRCFEDKTTINFSNLTGFVGSNGTGKSSVLEALARMFSIDKKQRNIISTDFYLSIGERLDDKNDRALYIEVKLVFPELSDKKDTFAIAECFKQMTVYGQDKDPYCRIRLEANWNKSNIIGGEIDQQLYWVNTTSDVIEDKDKKTVKPFERSRIHVHYIPANRDPQKQIKQTTGTIMYQLLKAVKWSDDILEQFEQSTGDIQNAFQKEKGVHSIQTSFSKIWNELFSSEMYQNININPISRNFEELLSKIEATFSPSPDGADDSSDRLSDGMKSLFYFTIIRSLFEIEEKILKNKEDHGFNIDEINPPALSVFAIEEPENHLAPHYIGRIIRTFRGMLVTKRAQILVTSHSPTIMKRIEPEEIRYLQLNEKKKSSVKHIKLPEEDDEAYKYVKEAVKAYPELYFSKLVILGEGDSEEIIIQRIAEAYSIPVDSSFVSIVPLGGRHVNHFWRLLNQLDIPYITLLDYDRRRGGGGWGRIKYVLEQLIRLGVPKKDLLRLKGGGIFSDEKLKLMHKRDLDEKKERAWITCLEKHNVYFSAPLDIDYLMFGKFAEYYKRLAPDNGGPRIPKKGSKEYEQKVKEAVASVRKIEASKVKDIDSIIHIERYFWYRYLFLGRGKPTSHIQALLEIPNDEIISNCPPVFKKMLSKVISDLNLSEGDLCPDETN